MDLGKCKRWVFGGGGASPNCPMKKTQPKPKKTRDLQFFFFFFPRCSISPFHPPRCVRVFFPRERERKTFCGGGFRARSLITRGRVGWGKGKGKRNPPPPSSFTDSLSLRLFEKIPGRWRVLYGIFRLRGAGEIKGRSPQTPLTKDPYPLFSSQ